MIEFKAREHFKSFPWVTHGRIELSSDFFGKATGLDSPIRFIDPPISFSVVVPVPSTSRLRFFRECLYGLLLQVYRNFEVIFVSHEDLSDWKEEFSDPRFSWVRKENASYAQLVSEGARLSRGEWLMFVHAEDVLSPVALFHFAREIHKQPCLDFLYANEAGVNETSTKITGIFSKPAFSWFNLVHFNGLGRAWTVKKSVLESVGGFSDRPDSDHDLFLRLSERESRVDALAAVLYYRRSDDIPWCRPIRKTVEEHLERRKIDVRILNGDTWKITPVSTEPHKISIVICFKNRSDITLKCLGSLRAQSLSWPLQIILVDNQSNADERARILESMKDFPHEWKLLDYDQPFNFADMNNRAVETLADGDILVLLNNDVEWTSKTALWEMTAWAALPWVGTVGALLRYPSGCVQHGGFSVQQRSHETSAVLAHALTEQEGAFLTREVIGTTFAAVAMRKEVFENLGGLRPLDFPNAFGDVVFNLECLRKGWTNLYLATAEGTHHESATRGRNFEFWEEREVLREYGDVLTARSRSEIRWDVTLKSFSLKHIVREAVMDGITRVSARSKQFERLCRRVPRLDALLTNQR